MAPVTDAEGTSRVLLLVLLALLGVGALVVGTSFGTGEDRPARSTREDTDRGAEKRLQVERQGPVADERPDSVNTLQRPLIRVLVTDSEGSAVTGALCRLGSDDQEQRTDSIGRAEFHLASTPRGVGLLVEAPGFFSTRSYVEVRRDGESEVRVQLVRQPAIRVLDVWGRPIPESRIELPPGAGEIAGAYDLGRSGAVIRAPNHISLPLFALSADLSSAFGDRQRSEVTVYLLDATKVPHLDVRIEGASGTRTYVRLTYEGRRKLRGLSLLSSALPEAAAIPEAWRRFYGGRVNPRLSTVDGEFFARTTSRGSETFSFSTDRGARVYGRGEAQLECWIEDCKKMTTSVTIGGNESSVRLTAVPESWPTKTILVKDVFDRTGERPMVRVRMTGPFQRDFGMHELGSLGLKLPRGEHRYTLRFRSNELGRATLRFGASDVDQETVVALGGMEVEVRFVHSRTREVLTHAEIEPKIGVSRGEWSEADKVFRFKGVTPGRLRVRIRWHAEKRRTTAYFDLAADPASSSRRHEMLIEP